MSTHKLILRQTPSYLKHSEKNYIHTYEKAFELPFVPQQGLSIRYEMPDEFTNGGKIPYTFTLQAPYWSDDEQAFIEELPEVVCKNEEDFNRFGRELKEELGFQRSSTTSPLYIVEPDNWTWGKLTGKI